MNPLVDFLKRFLTGSDALNPIEVPKDSPSLWESYRELPYERRNEFCLEILQDQLANQKYLLYGWPVQRLYSRYAADFLPDRTNLNILEIGPGDHLMMSALWMMEKRVKKLTLLDKFKGQYVDKAKYHAPLFNLIQTLLFLPREGFNNFYPFEEMNIERAASAIRFTEEGKTELDPERLEYRLIDDFTTFPFREGEFDYIYSHATLEHFTDPEASIAEMRRVLSPGGVMAHQIDIRDHRDFSDPYRYLEIPSADWKFGDMIFPVNQWRAHQFRNAFLKVGLEILHETKVRREPDKAKEIKFAPEFEAMPRDDLLITGVVFILRNPE